MTDVPSILFIISDDHRFGAAGSIGFSRRLNPPLRFGLGESDHVGHRETGSGLGERFCRPAQQEDQRHREERSEAIGTKPDISHGRAPCQ